MITCATPPINPPPSATQNLALNVADKGFSISVYNRSYDKTEAAVKRAQKEGAASHDDAHRRLC